MIPIRIQLGTAWLFAIFIVVFGTGALNPELAFCQDSIGRGKKALTEHGDLPWYDAESDGPKFSNLPEDGEIRRPTTSKTPTQRSNQSTRNGSVAGSAAAYTFWAIAILIFVVFVVILLWAFFRMEGKEKDHQVVSSPTGSAKETRAERLPYTINQASGDLLASARKFFSDGDFKNAMIHLYSHVLISLDEQGLIRLTRGKTNRQYLQEIRNHESIAHYLESCMIPFEEAFFGAREIPSSVVGECLNQFEQFQSALSRTHVVN